MEKGTYRVSEEFITLNNIKDLVMEYTGERFVPISTLMNDESAFEHFHRYHHVLEFVRGKKVLDIACGEGYGSAILAKTAKKVYGVDIDSACIEHATKTYQQKNLTFIQGDASQIPMETHAVDIIISFETIEHLDEMTQALFMKEAKRVLKPDGRLIISTPDKKNYSERYSHNNEFHKKEFTKEQFESFLRSYFKNTISLFQRYEIVDAISTENVNDLAAANVCDWVRAAKPIAAKYLISVCSDSPLEKGFLQPSVVFQVNKDYWQVTDRIVEMEAHILELGAWGRQLDKEIEERKMVLANKLNEIEILSQENKSLRDDGNTKSASLQKLSVELESKNNVIESFGKGFLDTTTRLLEMQTRLLEESAWTRKFHAELLQKEALLNEKTQQINSHNAEKKLWLEKEAKLENELSSITNELKKLESKTNDNNKIISEQKDHLQIAQLQFDSVNKRLKEIYDSDGWKVLVRYYKIKGKLLPENSQRYKVLRRAINKLRGRNVNGIHASVLNKPSTVIGDAQEEKKEGHSRKGYNPIEFYAFESPVVSIVMPAYNGWDLTYKCLASIKENTEGVSYEIIIGDDASTDETKNIKKYIKNISVIRNEKNLEFLHNCNNAANYAKGKYILFLNNDTEVRRGWLSSMVDLMEKDEKIGMTGSKLIYPDGILQEAGAIVWKDASGWNFGHRGDPEAPEFNYVKEADYISGASILIRTDLWKQIGGFDTRYAPAYCEDSDFAFEIRKRGYKVIYQPQSEVIHYEGYTHGTDKTEGIKEGSIKGYQKVNAAKFYEKWKDVLESEHFPNGEKVFWARDRSRNKKTILVVDHYVPHFDKDAGSRSTYQLLRLLVEMNYNVKFIGDNFYKHEPYTKSLQQMGIEVLYGTWFMNNWQKWINENKDMLDYVYLNRPHISLKYIDFIKENTKSKIIYFGHDLHYIRELKQYEIEKNPNLLESSNEWKKIEMQLSQKADVVLTLSEKERELAENELHAQQVVLMPIFYYDKMKGPVKDFSQRKNILFIGGFAHKPNVDGVLWFCREVWPLIASEIPNIKFIVAGSNPPQEILDLESNNVIIKGYVTETELETLYESVKLVVVPLRYGAGVKGKVIEAMYHGVPIVTSQFGIEGLPEIADALNPFDTAEAFSEQVIECYQSDCKLVSMSMSEVTYIEKHFSKEKMMGVVNSIF